MIAFCKANKIDFVVVGPEAPLVAGIVDDLEAAGFKTFGPTQGRGAARRLEGLHQGPVPGQRHPDRRPMSASPRPQPAKAYVRKQGTPIVIKADGLAAGKGVIIAETSPRPKPRST